MSKTAQPPATPGRRPRRRILTDRMVKELPRRPKRYFSPDPELPKHGVRVLPDGPPHDYYAICRDPYGKQVWKRIGSTAEIRIEEARDKAREIIRRVEAGKPAVEPAKPKPETVAAIATGWLTRHVDREKQLTAAEQRRIVSKYILPVWGSRNFAEIRRRDIAELLDHVEDQHGRAMADKVLAVVRAMATWLHTRDDTYTPPFVKGMRRVPKQDRRRDRVLSKDEVRSLWHAATNAGPFGILIKILLLTAQRRSKVTNMRWSDISPTGLWSIPGKAREKGTAGTVQLPKLALDLLQQLPRLVGNDHVFAGGNGRSRDFNFDTNKPKLDRASGVSDWRIHDLRRTARTLLSEAGVPFEHSERVLGHVIPGIAGVYDKFAYTKEKSDALAKLATLIDLTVNPPGANVVMLRETEVAS
jgi:integrase